MIKECGIKWSSKSESGSWKTYGKTEKTLGSGDTGFNRSPIRAAHFAFSPK